VTGLTEARSPGDLDFCSTFLCISRDFYSSPLLGTRRKPPGAEKREDVYKCFGRLKGSKPQKAIISPSSWPRCICRYVYYGRRICIIQIPAQSRHGTWTWFQDREQRTEHDKKKGTHDGWSTRQMLTRGHHMMMCSRGGSSGSCFIETGWSRKATKRTVLTHWRETRTTLQYKNPIVVPGRKIPIPLTVRNCQLKGSRP